MSLTCKPEWSLSSADQSFPEKVTRKTGEKIREVACVRCWKRGRVMVAISKEQNFILYFWGGGGGLRREGLVFLKLFS